MFHYTASHCIALHCSVLPVVFLLLLLFFSFFDCIVCVATLPFDVMANSDDAFNLEQTGTVAVVSAFMPWIEPLAVYTMFRS